MFGQLIAQTTQPATGGWRTWGVGEWLAIGGFVCVTLLPAIAAFLNSVRNRQQLQTVAQNVATTASATAANSRALNASPGGFNVSQSVISASDRVAANPNSPTPAPQNTAPVPAPSSPPSVQT